MTYDIILKTKLGLYTIKETEGKTNIYLSLGKSQGTQWDTQCDTKSPKKWTLVKQLQ